MEFIQNNKGGRKLIYQGFTYTRNKQSKTTVRWECSKKRPLSCPGALVTNLAETEVKTTREHCHPAEPFGVDAMRLRQEIRSCMKEGRGKPGQVLADKMEKYSKEVVVAAGSVDTIKRDARRVRKGTTPKEPNSLEDIPVPLPVDFTTRRDEPFLVYDNESAQARILVFCSSDGMKLLGDAETWFMDGTYSTAPSQFEQLFCIRVPLGESCASAAYALIPSKKQEAYEEVLMALLDACLQRDVRPYPSTVVADYEIGIHNAVRSVMSPSINIQGCFYHLTQSTWRKIQDEGLQRLYKDDSCIRQFCGMLDGLAFLPVGSVKEGMAFLRTEAPDNMLELVEYFDQNYVSGEFRVVRGNDGVMRFRRTKPRFDLPLWNVHHATMTDSSRTNNFCESWNNSFRNLVGHKNPSLWTVIKCLRKDAAMVEADVLRLDQGQPAPKRKRKGTIYHQRRLKTLCQQFVRNEKTVAQFLIAMGECIRIH